ncbi:MAG: hypothetical protein A3C93_04310 [Candidatus Lloydbacteria bacterium RIFCSPHIGHO2_02_FULL_54_17]|uniref:Uncharacterized protein n=1 Tax=Candidatus Lloydbacteria bacterium RIFCSPHIGHO2_02_FULL_54_17 TaxID=1798664 RepID=A0A1G2DD90_9BACT|nr:MAG: hypothetical protein A3C93_04310 [Candidatus Lloydbacteria bacterium RIFCSPHIGHO2_02_FULL_54_17]OGZ16998.1 MAG: hypothetical protein A3H76_06345 [Candidatus Lloydbacteria bacterium RIFCSPLOWO2_02_FULL_54_12]
MANIVLGGIFVVLVLIGYGVIYPETAGKPSRTRLMRACVYCIVWSLLLSTLVLFATESGIAEMTPLATIFWSYAGFMGAVIGVIGLIGVALMWLVQKSDLPLGSDDKNASENDRD